MVKMKISKREKGFILIVCVVVIIFIYCNYYLLPLLKEYALLKNRVGSSRIEFEGLEIVEKKMNILMRNIEKSKEEMACLETVVPYSKNTPEIIVELEDLSRQSEIKLQEIVFQNLDKDKKTDNNTGKDKDYLEIRLQLKIEGSYENILTFFKGLENSTRLFVVNNISLTQKYQTAGDMITVQMGVSAFSTEQKE